MKKEILPSLLLTVLCIVLFSTIYPILMWCIAQIAPGKGEGAIVRNNGKTCYANIAQRFTDNKYFWPRPSAVAYNAAGSGGSNKGPTNPEYLAAVQQRIDTFIAHNPAVKKTDIPSELVTASGSGLDPDISIHGAMVQVQRIAQARNIPPHKIEMIIHHQIQKPLLGILGPEKINVLKLNLELDNIK